MHSEAWYFGGGIVLQSTHSPPLSSPDPLSDTNDNIQRPTERYLMRNRLQNEYQQIHQSQANTLEYKEVNGWQEHL